LGDLGVDGSVPLEWILQKYNVMAWPYMVPKDSSPCSQ